MKEKRYLSPRILRRLLEYCPDTGHLRWKRRPAWMFSSGGRGGRRRNCSAWNAKYAGKRALDTVHNQGYRSGRVLDKDLLAHRVAWVLTHGEWPTYDIDHINRDRSDNRLSNLRAVSRKENMQNGSLPSHNTSGIIGVYWYATKKKWIAAITVDRKQKNLGYFTNKEDAAAARLAAERKFGFHPNHGKDLTKGRR